MTVGPRPLFRKVAARDDLVRPLTAQGLQVLTAGDARLRRDVTNAVADSARLIDELAAGVGTPFPSAGRLNRGEGMMRGS